MKRFMKFYINLLTFIMMTQSVVVAGGDEAVGIIGGAVAGIINVAAYFGYAISFGMVFWIGAKYALSAAGDKANLKQGVISYLIGAVLIFGASLIANTVSSLASGGAQDLTSGIIGG